MNNMSATDLVVNKSRREISVDSKIQPIRVTSIFGLSGGKCGCHVRWRIFSPNMTKYEVSRTPNSRLTNPNATDRQTDGLTYGWIAYYVAVEGVRIIFMTCSTWLLRRQTAVQRSSVEDVSSDA